MEIFSMKKEFKKIFTLAATAIIILIMAVVYFVQTKEVVQVEIAEEIPSRHVNLINREENEVVEISFYADGVRTFLTPQVDENGRRRWEYSAASGYALQAHLVREKARPAWIITAVDTAFETAEAVELSQFGLQPPALVVESVFSDGTRHELRLGSRTADLQYFFLMIDDDPAIYLITDVLGDRMRRGAAEMLDMSVPHMAAWDAEFVQIGVRGAAPIVIALRGEDFPPSPLEGLVDEVGGEQLIMYEPIPGMTLSHSRFIEYVIHPMSQMRLREIADIHPRDLTPFGLHEPSLEFIFRAAQTEIHLQFGDTFLRDEIEFIYVKFADRPHVFVAESSYALAVSAVNPLDIVDRFLALAPISDVERITVNAENSYEIVMNHTFETFDIAPTLNGVSAQDTAVRQIFVDMLGLLADAEISPRAPLGTPQITITYHRIANPNTQLRFFDYNANFFAVSIDGGEMIFATSRRALNRLIENLDGLVQ
jgi:hypothetical protein